MRPGERQVAPELSGIRRDHLARYEWAARTLPPGCSVVDLACGVGYGAFILAEAGHHVVAIDCDAEAIDYARTHYGHERIEYRVGSAGEIDLPDVDAAVCFETIEHVEDPMPLLRALRTAAPMLLASVPNENVMPYTGQAFHYRHYRPDEFDDLLTQAGFNVTGRWRQVCPQSDVEEGVTGRTAIVQALRNGAVLAGLPPQHVAIVGLGPSVVDYMDLVKRLGGRSALADEVWAINSLGDVFGCDRIFHMDDVRIQEIRAAAMPKSNIAAMLAWMRRHPGPIVTSRAHPDYPGLIEFPLQAVINNIGLVYFNNTAAYAVAYAIHIGVRKLSLFGMDFTYPNAHDAERGRACVEFWLGVAMERGIELVIAERSTLLDVMAPEDERLYGYDTLEVTVRQGVDGLATVDAKPRDKLPTAADIERRYDHSKHPNRLVADQKAVPAKG